MESIFELVFKQVLSRIGKSDIPISSIHTEQVAAKITEAVAPIVVNAQNDEPLWKSRIVRGLLLAAIGVLGGYFGVHLTDTDVNDVLQLATSTLEVIGLAYALYGRLVGGKKAPPKL